MTKRDFELMKEFLQGVTADGSCAQEVQVVETTKEEEITLASKQETIEKVMDTLEEQPFSNPHEEADYQLCCAWSMKKFNRIPTREQYVQGKYTYLQEYAMMLVNNNSKRRR